MQLPHDIERIVTHNDFDGIVSAALLSKALGCDSFLFTGPGAVSNSTVTIGIRDAVCDLPYPLECGLWFDHHAGNLDVVKLRGIDPETIPGRFDTKPSCARVILGHLTGLGLALPGFYEETVAETDTIDSFDYRSVEEWRRETPGKLVDMSLKARVGTRSDHFDYLDYLAGRVRDNPLAAIAAEDEVLARIREYRGEEEKMSALLKDGASFLEGDRNGELVVVDLTHHKREPRVQRNLAYILHPGALGAAVLSPVFRGGTKTNDISVSISLSMNMTGREHAKDMGEIMRLLNIGDGHPGAAAGTVHCDSKDAMLRAKKKLLADIWRIWASMDPGKPA
ncbi:MAG: hypothetical protein MUF59_08570 [Candidatus Krumholzibacteria bacterium]|jgi:hypothetical protein|nr:hypothetical protein [Candidatus Krumholzibacteria bacterium]